MKDHRPTRLSQLLTPTIMASLVAAILVSAPTAGAISSGDQYIPKIDKGGVSGSDQTGLAVGVGAGAIPSAKAREAVILRDQQAVLDGGTAGGGTVPGTDFPLTLFVVIIGALLATGLLVRLFAPALDRRT